MKGMHAQRALNNERVHHQILIFTSKLRSLEIYEFFTHMLF